MRRLFITGTDTGVGKTHAACALMRRLVAEGHRVAGMKPIASGCDATPDGLRNDDALALMAAANVALPYDMVNPYAFAPAIAPHIAADQAGVLIEPGRLAAIADGIDADYLVIEGAGGWCVPIGPGPLLADLVRPLARRVILVVGMRLGCINHALLSESRIVADGFELVGWIANTVDPEMPVFEENLTFLKDSLSAPLLETLPWVPT